MMRPFRALIPARLLGEAQSVAAPVRRPPLRRRGPRPTLSAQLIGMVTRRGVGSAFAILFLSASAMFGFVRGGQYEAFLAEAGRPADVLAKVLGFGVRAITLTGQKELLHGEIVQASGITSRDSVVFLDAQAVRLRLKALPLVREATVRKLYPDQIVIHVTERTPYALWQVDGEVSVIAADGTAIDQMRDQRFTKLPFVVGEGANARVPEYLKIIEAAGELKGRITAGVLVGQRRWNVKLNNGIDVRLPEADPEGAIARFAALVRDQKLADKDIISVDMRARDRVVVRLSEEAAAQRMEAKTKKARPKGSAA